MATVDPGTSCQGSRQRARKHRRANVLIGGHVGVLVCVGGGGGGGDEQTICRTLCMCLHLYILGLTNSCIIYINEEVSFPGLKNFTTAHVHTYTHKPWVESSNSPVEVSHWVQFSVAPRLRPADYYTPNTDRCRGNPEQGSIQQ